MLGKSTEDFKIELCDLQSLLSKKFSDQLLVVNFSTESLLPPGENYGGTIVKVHAIIKKHRHAAEEDLHLVAKMPPATEFQRMIFDSPYTFKKETVLYEELIPHYQKFEREFGDEKSQVFDIVPEFYGARFSLINEDLTLK